MVLETNQYAMTKITALNNALRFIEISNIFVIMIRSILAKF